MAHRFAAALIRTAAVMMIAAATGPAAAPAAAPCTPGKDKQRIQLTLDVPETQAVISVVAALTYDPAHLDLPANADLRRRVTAAQPGAMITPRNAPGTLRLVAAKAAGLTSGSLADVEFDACAEQRPASTSELHCKVESCAGTGGPIPDCYCSVALP